MASLRERRDGARPLTSTRERWFPACSARWKQAGHISLREAAGGKRDQASAVGGPAEPHVMREEGLAGRAQSDVALPAGRGWTEFIWKLPATRDWCRARAIVAAKLGISAAARGKGYER